MARINDIHTNTTTTKLETWIPFAESEYLNLKYFSFICTLFLYLKTFSFSLNICKEVADGLRVYFDFTLGDLLLYSQEKAQFADLTKSDSPIKTMTVKIEAKYVFPPC